jgi:hypothetical protein
MWIIASPIAALCPSSMGLVAVHPRVSNCELLDRATGRQRGHQPARLLAAPGPGFRWLARILVLWKDARIFASLATFALRRLRVGRPRLTAIFFPAELSETFFKFALLGGQSNREGLANLLMKLPHLIDRHRVKIEFFAHSRFLPLRFALANRKKVIWT